MALDAGTKQLALADTLGLNWPSMRDRTTPWRKWPPAPSAWRACLPGISPFPYSMSC